MRFSVAAFVLVTLVSSCVEQDDSQIVVLMDTDYAVPDEVDRIRARVTREVFPGEPVSEPWVRMFDLATEGTAGGSETTLPATFGVLPGAVGRDPLVVIELQAIAAGSNRVLLTRTARTGFVPGESRLIRMLLYRACEGESCPAGQACGCDDGAACSSPSCVDEAVDARDLEAIDNPGELPARSAFPDPPDDTLDGGVPPGEDDVDCRTEGSSCTGFTYCDDESGRCERGCAEDDQCARSNERCDTDSHRCVCQPGTERCQLECVDTESDPRFCGDCDTSCPSGQACETGECFNPSDCRNPGVECLGFTYCDETTGACERGCARDEQCSGSNERCETNLHECVCQADYERCRFDCVNTEVDPRFCGNCDTSCGSGEVCEQGDCLDPGDCRLGGVTCTGFTYCDETGGDCLFGCARDEQCTGTAEACDTEQHACVCVSGFHRCGEVCRSDDSVETCGQSCVPCPVPANASPTCEMGVCGFQCDAEYEPCGDACCPIVDPCTCEAAGVECGNALICDTTVSCGACPGGSPFCQAGICVCADAYEPNDSSSSPAEVTCDGECSLKSLDLELVGSLDRPGDVDFYELDVKHESDRALRISVSDLQSTRELFLTYVCPDGGQAVEACSGSSSSVGSLTFCTEDDSNTLALIQECGDTKPPRGTVIVGVGAKQGEYVGLCDTYRLSIRSFFFEVDD